MAQAKQNKTRRPANRTLENSGRIPPHSLEMERAVLCACLIDPNGLTKVIDVLGQRSFYERRHQLVYDAMVSLFRQSSPVDILTVSEQLARENYLDSAGGEVYLAQLSGETATSAHAEHYARIIQDRAALRELIIASTDWAEKAYDIPNSQELLDEAMGRLFEIYSNRKTGGFETIRNILNSTHEWLDEVHRKHDDALTGVGTGFDELDLMTSGFQKGDLIVIAGRPSMGKTAFSLDLARNAAKMYGTAVAYFSLPMASMAIALRLIASEARINLHKLRSGRLSDQQFGELSRATAYLSELKFFIDDSGSLGVNELRARARRLKQQHDVGIIFVDYLQLMQPPDAQSREQEVAQISRALKGLARELEVPVVALSQLSRAVETRGGDRIPQLADLRDSGAIEQDADVVMFIHRKKMYRTNADDDEGEPVDNTADIIIRKQRNGPTGSVKLIFNDEFTRFENMAVVSDRSLKMAPAKVDVDYVGDAPAEVEETPF